MDRVSCVCAPVRKGVSIVGPVAENVNSCSQL
jgi:hypothetical protein